METQRIAGESADYIVLQARTAGGKWKQIIGMDKAITVRFIKQSFHLVCMEIGEAKWADKGAAMAVSMFVLWPFYRKFSPDNFYKRKNQKGVSP